MLLSIKINHHLQLFNKLNKFGEFENNISRQLYKYKNELRFLL